MVDRGRENAVGRGSNLTAVCDRTTTPALSRRTGIRFREDVASIIEQQTK